MNYDASNPMVKLAEMAGVSVATVYSRAKEIAQKEGKVRLPTLQEVLPRKAGRKSKFI